MFTACGIMHRRSCLEATSSVHYTTSIIPQSSAPEDGRNYRPKHVELIDIINKLLLLHPVGCLYYCISFSVINSRFQNIIRRKKNLYNI